MGHKIDFLAMQWIEAAPGLRYKKYLHNKQQIRLAEFSEGFIEEDWCTKAHSGYVVEGTFAINYNGEIERYCEGDAFHIPSGDAHKHKVIMAQGEKAVLLLCENTDEERLIC